MEKTTLEQELWGKLDALTAEKDEMLKAVAPLEVAKARHQKTEEEARLKIREYEKRIKDRLGTRMASVCRDLAIIGKALHGKARPKD
jgi:hypothetical protein